MSRSTHAPFSIDDLGVQARDVGAGQAQVGFAAAADREQRLVDRDDPPAERIGHDQSWCERFSHLRADYNFVMRKFSYTTLGFLAMLAATASPLAETTRGANVGPAPRRPADLHCPVLDRHVRRRVRSNARWTAVWPTPGSFSNRLRAAKGPRTVDNTLRPYDDAAAGTRRRRQRRRS